MPSIPRVVVLGGAGHFGSRICRSLADEAGIEIIVAGRNLARSQAYAEVLRGRAKANLYAVQLDHSAADFEERLSSLDPTVVVNTAGPFQGQDYRVARACIACTSHYLDLADGREFVASFGQLDGLARRQNVLLVSGASTLPAVSSAVIEKFRSRFETIRGIEISIAPANKTPRGAGTIAAVLSYCGKPFQWLRDGRWETAYGWQDLKTHNYPSLGRRWLGACDVPDLTLFPKHYPDVETVTFHAALELAWQQFGLWAMAWPVRLDLMTDWSKHVKWFKRMSDRFESMGTDTGGMHVRIWGDDSEQRSRSLTWYLTAHRNHGPEIPCVPAILLTRRLIRGETARRGAHPCIEFITLDEFDDAVSDFDISWTVVEGER